MELSDLLTFSTVARLGGITRAADELNTVQSNVTQRVKALEAEIGTALFERHSHATLTGAGRRLLPYAQHMAPVAGGAAGGAGRWRTEGTARDRIDGDDRCRSPAFIARRIPSPLPVSAIEFADIDDGRAGGGCAQRDV